MSLTGKSAIVTGASRGIGRAIAIDLAARGVSVVVNYNSSVSAAQEVLSAIAAAGGKAVAVRGDVSKPEDANAVVKAAIDAYGKVDILVNNAGTTRDTLLMTMKEEDWDVVIDTDLKSVYN
ncbi:MAG TPA: SDR family NAD(P)-dependent oxidoreductase, partial [Anaerolineae bacterium]